MITNVIGISGVARAGKNTFANILKHKLKEAGMSIEEFAFADALKQDCYDFCQEKLGISSFTQVPAEKLVIRPLLVWYGDAKRKQTNGRYWVDIIDRKVRASTADFCLVTDVRYDFYPRDEINWVKDDCCGIVVHVSRRLWNKDGVLGWEFVPPANDHERENDPKVKAKADFVIEWNNVDGLTMDQLSVEPSLVAHVDAFIAKFNLI